MTRRSCDELGVCQGSGACHCDAGADPVGATLDTPPPGGFWFAPGTIEGVAADDFVEMGWGESLAAYTMAGGALAGFFALLGLSLGYLKLPGWLG